MKRQLVGDIAGGLAGLTVLLFSGMLILCVCTARFEWLFESGVLGWGAALFLAFWGAETLAHRKLEYGNERRRGDYVHIWSQSAQGAGTAVLGVLFLIPICVAVAQLMDYHIGQGQTKGDPNLPLWCSIPLILVMKMIQFTTRGKEPR